MFCDNDIFCKVTANQKINTNNESFNEKRFLNKLIMLKKMVYTKAI